MPTSEQYDKWTKQLLRSNAFLESSQRLQAVAQGRKPDRTPVVAFIDGYPAILAGMPLGDYYTDIENNIKAQLHTKAFLQVDDSPSYGWADWGGWEFGGAIQMPTSAIDTAPRTAVFPVTCLADVDRLQIPDPQTAGMFPNLSRFNQIIRVLGYPAKIRGGSVSSIVAGMVSAGQLMKWYLQEPQAVHCLYDKAADFVLKAAEMTIEEYGAENCSVFLSTPVDSNNLVSEKIFRSFSWPRIRMINQQLIEKGVNRFFVHLCGRHDQNLAAWAELPWPERTIFSIGEMDLEKVAAAFDHRHIIGGNISTSLLSIGSAADVYAEACRCIEIGRKLPGGFILMPACSMPLLTPPLNVHAMIAASRTMAVSL